MQKTRRRFLQSVVECAKQKKPIVFPNNETSEASCSRLFFAYVFTRKWSANQRKKIQGCDFLLNRRPHAKIQLIWTKKKNRPNFDIEWLCSKVFCYSQEATCSNIITVKAQAFYMKALWKASSKDNNALLYYHVHRGSKITSGLILELGKFLTTITFSWSVLSE